MKYGIIGEKMPLEIKAKFYAIKCHSSTNHYYEGIDYEYHLKMVVKAAHSFRYVLGNVPEEEWEKVIAACWCHDVIEDTRQTYNDVKEVVGEDVADIVFALTNEKGKTRKERANDKYYEGIRATRFASFVKICDRIANVTHSVNSGSKMAEMYAREGDFFGQQLFNKALAPMFSHLNELLDSNRKS